MQCQVCAAKADKQCSMCFSAKYCSKKCQIVDWSTHKHECYAKRGAGGEVQKMTAKMLRKKVHELMNQLREAETTMDTDKFEDNLKNLRTDEKEAIFSFVVPQAGTLLQRAVNSYIPGVLVPILLNAGATLLDVPENALFMAVQRGSPKAVRLLAEKASSAIKNDALKEAYRLRDRQIMDILIRKNGTMSKEVASEQAYETFKSGEMELGRLLIEAGGDPNFRPSDADKTMLMLAVGEKSVESIELLIEKGADVSAKDGGEYTALHIAEDVDIISLLLSKGAEIDMKARNGQTPLMLAVENGSKEIVRRLIRKGASMEMKDEDGDTVLHTAVRVENVEIAQLLISKGTEANTKNDDDKTPAMLVFFRNYRPTSKQMLKYIASEPKFDLNERDREGESMLQMAVSEKVSSIFPLRILLSAKHLDVNDVDQKGRSILFYILTAAHMREIRRSKREFDLDVQDERGNTALIWSLWKGQPKKWTVPTGLIEMGADVAKENADGKTALMITIERNNFRIRDKIVLKDSETMAFHSTKNEKQYSVLMHAVKNLPPEPYADEEMQQWKTSIWPFMEEMVEYLSAEQLRYEAPNGETAYTLALKYDQKKVADLLEKNS